MHRFRVLPEHNSQKRRKVRKLVIRPLDSLSSTTLDSPNTTPPAFTTPSPARVKRRNRVWQLCLLWLSCILGLSGLGVAAFFLLATLPPQVDCRRITMLSPDMERLYCAEQAARSGKLDQLIQSITFVQSFSESHPLYGEAQRLLEQWSQTILQLARQKVDKGDLEGAVATARQVPKTSPLYAQAQETVRQWQEDWQQAGQIQAKFQQALKAQDWFAASQLVQALRQLNSRYWSQKPLDQLMERLAFERQAWQLLKEARGFAEANTPEQLATAIALASRVNSDSYVKAEATVEKERWSRVLVDMAAASFEEQAFEQVIDAANGVPTDSTVYRDAQDWIQLSRAHLAAKEKHLLGLLEAYAAVRSIPPKSPLYSRAKQVGSLWESQFQDRLQLQFANAIASFEQPWSFQLAMEQAQLIAPKRPERLLAQTLVAHWRKQIQQIEDRNTLAQARQLAQPGTLEYLRAAVAQAGLIQLGQPLRVEAQTLIAQWTRQIQVLEDQPILDLARAFAQQGNLKAAVQAAQQILPGRALYAEAQTNMSDWVAQIQIAEDRPVLDAATALAAEGRLTDAINKASQISPGRALYDEAQVEIARWASEREAILAERRERSLLEGVRTESDDSFSEETFEESNN